MRACPEAIRQTFAPESKPPENLAELNRLLCESIRQGNLYQNFYGLVGRLERIIKSDSRALDFPWGEEGTGNTLCHLAAAPQKHTELLRRLLQTSLAGDLERQNNNGQTPEEMASPAGKAVILDYKKFRAPVPRENKNQAELRNNS